MERIDPIETSEGDYPNWWRVFIALVVGFVAVQWTIGPLLGWIRPDTSEIGRYLIVKGVTFAWIAWVVMRSTGWAAIGFRLPVRPASALYATPFLLLGAAALTGGVATTLRPAAEMESLSDPLRPPRNHPIAKT